MVFSKTTEIYASNKREAQGIARNLNRDESRHIKIAINSIKLKRKTSYGQNVYSARQRSRYYRFDDNQESQMQRLTKKESKEKLLRQRDWNTQSRQI